MQWLAVYVVLLDISSRLFFKIVCSASEFSLQGDYLLGGLFSLHIVQPKRQAYPVALECQRYDFDKASYQMLQMMRFAVEEINNSSTLLPRVSLGYEIFDHCSNAQNFPSIFTFISRNGSIPVHRQLNNYQPKIIAVTGPSESTRTITIAPFFMLDLIPMVNYGSSSYELSNKKLYPSFLRTVPNNKDLIYIIIYIIKHFGWNWVAFIGSKDDYSQDGLSLFYQYSRQNSICLAYQELLSPNSDYRLTLQKLEKLNIKVIVIFSVQVIAKNIIKSAIKNNIKNKIWIAGEGWSMSKDIQNEPGIQNIGKIVGITGKLMDLPGFDNFIYRTHRNTGDIVGYEGQNTCNQVCDKCPSISSEDIINENPTFSFPVYAAIYTIAHALNNVLHCDANGCNKSIPVYPFMLLKEMKTLNFSLNGQQIKYDQNSDPLVSYVVVLWRTEANPPFVEIIGDYNTYPEITFTIYKSFTSWFKDVAVPFGKCSAECKEGYQREQDRNRACCFQCKVCPSNTYINATRDPYTCVKCNAEEWSEEGSTFCETRTIMYVSFTDPLSVLVIIAAASLIALCIAVIMLFSYNYNTPVVKSAGGNMCFLMLTSLILASISVFFFFGRPTVVHCVFRNVMFYFFHSICFSCMAVRSFQIVCVFKMAAKFPKVHRLWANYNGQWLVVVIICIAQLICCILWVSIKTPVPSRDESSYKDEIILGCSSGAKGPYYMMVFLIWFLSVLCFAFSYMGTDLPKNYNEAKSITYSMLLFYISWSFFFTADITYVSVYVQLFQAIAQLSSLFGILLSYFIPKSYVIIFQPKKNTQAYFQTSIQTYTQTISRM